MTRLGLVLLIGLAACSKGSEGGSRCRAALQHALDIYSASSEADTSKKDAHDHFEDGVRACEAEHPPDAVFDCTLKAKTVDDLRDCDALRVR